MKDEITYRVPEELLHWLESDAKRKNMTLEEAAVHALKLYYADREIRRQLCENGYFIKLMFYPNVV